MIRVLLVDDDDRVRRGWQMRLALEPDLVVVGTAGDMTTAISTAAAARPHVILLDIELPGPDGLSGIAALRRAAPRPPSSSSPSTTLRPTAGRHCWPVPRPSSVNKPISTGFWR